MKDKKIIVYKILIVVLSCMLVIITTLLIHPFSFKLKENYTRFDFTYKNNNEIRRALDKLFNVNYIYTEEWLDIGVGGETIFIGNSTPIVIMSYPSMITRYDYTSILAHELTHVKYPQLSEKETEFKSFVILYESNDSFFKNVALYKAHQLVLLPYDKTYDCSQELIQYINS